MAQEYIVTTDKLTKKYGNKIAANEISLKIRPGEIYGLIGRNGAGKTTVMRMLSGLTNPTEGSFTLFGKTGRTALGEEMHNVGVLIESPGIFPKMNAYDNIRAKCIVVGRDDPEYINGLLETVGLSKTGKKKAGDFSLGMRQRLGIALALIGEPKLMILDEPINGLDPQGIVEVRETLARLRDEKGITMMISSHILEELAKLADHFGVLENGFLIDEFTPEEIHKRTGNYTLINTDDNQTALKLIKEMGFEDAEIDSDHMVRLKSELSKEKDVVKLLVNNDLFVKEVRQQPFSLEDYYLQLTKEEQK